MQALRVQHAMPIQVNLNELEAPPPAPAPAPQQVPSWAQPSNRTERRCVATNDVTVRAAAALDSEVVGELRAGDHCTVDGQQHISRQGRVVERSRICAPRGPVHNSNCRGTSSPLLNRDLHAIDATPARRRGGVIDLRTGCTAGSRRSASRRPTTSWR